MPLQTNYSPARDCATFVKVPPTGLVRGNTATEDYNVKLRGRGLRVDLKPKTPYP